MSTQETRETWMMNQLLMLIEVNKKRSKNGLDTVILQLTGGKDEPNFFFMRISYRTSQLGTQNVNTHNRTTQKTKKMTKARYAMVSNSFCL